MLTPIDDKLMSPKIVEAIRRGRYEMGEAGCLSRLVREGERVVEVGAGIGVLTTLIARTTPAELVVGIEANPALGTYIEALYRLNGAKAELRQALVTPGRGPKTAPFYVHHDLWASSPGWIGRRNIQEVVQAPVLSLAEIAEAWRPSLLIVDIEPFAAWCEAEAPPHALAGADFRPFERVLLELKLKRFPPEVVKRVFDHFSAQGFAYDAAVSAGPLVLFQRL